MRKKYETEENFYPVSKYGQSITVLTALRAPSALLTAGCGRYYEQQQSWNERAVHECLNQIRSLGLADMRLIVFWWLDNRANSLLDRVLIS